MPDRISSVYDIPGWVRERLPPVPAPLRYIGESMRAIPAAIADKGRSLYHGALGLDDPNEGASFDATMAAREGALAETVAPFKGGLDAARGGLTNAMEYLRDQAIKAGAKPKMTPPDPMPPLNTGPGMIDAELRAGAPSPMPKVAPRPARPPVTIDQAPQGAVAPTGVPVQRGAQATAVTQEPRGALDEPVAPAPRQSLSEMFKQRMASLPQAEGKLSPEDLKQRKLEFFMNMLARNKGGSLFLQNAAAAGLDTSAGIRSDRERAQTRAAQQRREGREDIFREIGFADKDEDNRRLDAGEARRMKLLEKQINQGKLSVQKSAAGTYVILDAQTGQSKDTGIKFPKESKTDGRSAELQLIEHLKKNPEDLELVLQLKGKGEDKDAGRVFNAATERLTRDLSGDVTVEGAVGDARRMLELSQGGGQKMLPKGVPPGSKQVGTSKGKPVYEAPNGKRYVVE